MPRVLGVLAFAWSGALAALEGPPAPLPPAPPIYFSATQIDSIAALASPPAQGSEADRKDLEAVLERQKAALADGTLERSIGDAELSCKRVADVLPAPAVAPGEGGNAVDFATRAALQAASVVGPPKLYWHRPRPYMASPKVVRRADVAPDYPVPPEYARDRDISSYPSGHTAFATACAIVLSLMVPEQRVALFARARLYADARMVVGAHYPTDLEAGRIIGTTAAAIMLQDHQYQVDLRQATAALRSALHLPATPPPPGN